MKVLNIVMDPSSIPNPRLNLHSRCAYCGRSYVGRRGILARLEHGTEIPHDEHGYRYLVRGVKVYSYRSPECFVAMIKPDGHA